MHQLNTPVKDFDHETDEEIIKEELGMNLEKSNEDGKVQTTVSHDVALSPF